VEGTPEPGAGDQSRLTKVGKRLQDAPSRVADPDSCVDNLLVSHSRLVARAGSDCLGTRLGTRAVRFIPSPSHDAPGSTPQPTTCGPVP